MAWLMASLVSDLTRAKNEKKFVMSDLNGGQSCQNFTFTVICAVAPFPWPVRVKNEHESIMALITVGIQEMTLFCTISLYSISLMKITSFRSSKWPNTMTNGMLDIIYTIILELFT